MGTLSGTLATNLNASLPPDGVTNLLLWLKADDIVGTADGGQPTDWYDGVGGLDFQQGNATARAVLHTASGSNNRNGHAWMEFDGANDWYQTTANVNGANTPVPNNNTQFWVIRTPASYADHGALASYQEPSNEGANHFVLYTPVHQTPDALTWDMGSAGVAVNVPSGWYDTWHVLEVHRTAASSGGACQFLVDGQLIGGGVFTTDLTYGAWGAKFNLGGWSGTFALFSGGIAEWCSYGRDLSATERTAIRNGLATKYGVVVGGGVLAYAEQEEFNGPFSSWRNIVTADGADPTAGADSTTAFQSALASGVGTIYLPAGTYRISDTLRFNLRRGLRMIGHDPADTRIVWDGPAGSDDRDAPSLPAMIETDGWGFGTLSRITFDGQMRAGSTGVNLAWTPSGGDPGSVVESMNEFVDCTFRDLSYGVRCGTGNNMGSETHFRRCHFVNNWSAAVSTWNYNALDVWIDDCLFEQCYVNATNEGHGKGYHVSAGNFHLRRCRSRGATWSFASYCNTSQNFHFLDCISYQDNSFFNACDIGVNGAPVVIQRCQILDPVLNLTPERASNFTVKPWRAVIEMGNPGPLVLLDTDIRLPVGWNGSWAVLHVSPPFQYVSGGPPEADATFVDCRISDEASLGSLSVNGDALHYNTQFVPRGNLSTPAAATAGIVHCPLVVRTIIEPATASSAGIQAAIDSCATLVGSRPVVHLPRGTYNLTAGLTFPAGSDAQLVGDGFDEGGTLLMWQGPSGGQIVTVTGPSTVCLRDLQMNGDLFAAHGTGNGLLVQQADQAGSRVNMVGTLAYDPGNNEAAFDLAGIDRCVVRSDGGGNSAAGDAGRGALGTRHTGGALLGAGGAGTGLFVGMGLACGARGEVYRVQNGGHIISIDSWWEDGEWLTFVHHNNRGSLSFVCSNVQPAHAQGNAWEDSGGTSGSRDGYDFTTTSPNGDLSLLAVTHSAPYLGRRLIEGPGTASRVLMLDTVQQGERDDKPWASQATQWVNTSPSTQFAQVQSKGSSHDGWLYPLADALTNVPGGAGGQEAFVRSLLDRIRTRLPDRPPAGIKGAPTWAKVATVPPGATDLWLSRIHTFHSWVPLRITDGGAAPPPTGIDPLTLGSLVARWRAQDLAGLLDGDPAALWVSTASGSLVLGQSANPSQPRYQAGALSGRAALVFDGVDDFLSAGNPAALNFTGPFTAQFVLRFTDDVNYAMIATKSFYPGGSAYEIRRDGTTNSLQFTGAYAAGGGNAVGTGSLGLTAPHVYTVVVDPTGSGQWYVDGTANGTPVTFGSTAWATVATEFLVGARKNPSGVLEGYCAPMVLLEMNLYTGALAPGDRHGTEVFLGDYYNLTVG